MNINPVVQECPVTLQESSSLDRSPRILFAVRNSQVRKSFLSALIQRNVQVHVCEDGESAWRILLKQQFDLLVTGQDMPRLSGLALIRQLRLADIEIPIILIAQGAITESVSQDPWHKIAAVLPRSFTAEALLGAVNNVLALCLTVQPESSR